MPNAQALVGIATVVMVVALLGASAILSLVEVLPWFRAREARRRGREASWSAPGAQRDAEAPSSRANAPVSSGGADPSGARPASALTVVPQGTADRALRILSWAFLMAVALLAAAAGLEEATIYRVIVLVAVTGVVALVLQELLPSSISQRFRGTTQAIAAIGFAAVLVVLTGGVASPFGFAFLLIVGAGSLLVSRRSAALLAIGGASTYVLASLLGGAGLAGARVVELLGNLTGMLLLAFAGSSLRAEPRSVAGSVGRAPADELTGLLGRDALLAALDREIARGERSGRGFSLILMELDGLDAVNGRMGRAVGDRLLRQAAAAIADGVRQIDIAARYGGDAFAILLPETEAAGGNVVAEKLRGAIVERALPVLGRDPVVAHGVVGYPIDGRSAEALVARAERAVTASRRTARDRPPVEVAEAVPVPTPSAVEVRLATMPPWPAQDRLDR